MAEANVNGDLRLVAILCKSSKVVKKISAALSIMLDKRATLEEKMIKAYFIKLASLHSQVIGQILAALAAKNAKIAQEILTDLATIADSTILTIDEFLKAAQFDHNYLEQYFEHKFLSELESSDLLENSLKVFASLDAIVRTEDYRTGS